MRISIKHIVLIIISTIVLSSCRKDPSWDIEGGLPILKADLGLENIIAESLLSNSDDSCLTFIFDKEIYSLTADSIVKIPDSLFYLSFSIPFSADAQPGALFYSKTESKHYNLNDAKLTDAKIRSGKLQITAYNEIEKSVYIEYKINNSLRNGAPVSLNITIPNTSNNNESICKEFDISGTTLDLRGSYLNCNSLSSTIKIYADPNATGNIHVNYGNKVRLLIRFVDIQLEYAKGYFGQHNFSKKDTIDIDFISNLGLNYLDIDDAKLSIDVSNGLGADASMQVNELCGFGNANINLNSSWIGNEINMSRAWQSNSEGVTPTLLALNFDNDNIEEFIENLPNKISYDLKAAINPLGNISSGNDFISHGKGLTANVHAEIPLNAAFSNLILKDTFDYEIEKKDSYISKTKLQLEIANGFPIETAIQIYFLDQESLKSDSLEIINLQSAEVNTSGLAISPKTTNAEITLSEQQMNHFYNSKKIMIYAKFNTGGQTHQKIKISSTNRIKIKINAIFDYHIET